MPSISNLGILGASNVNSTKGLVESTALRFPSSGSGIASGRVGSRRSSTVVIVAQHRCSRGSDFRCRCRGRGRGSGCCFLLPEDYPHATTRWQAYSLWSRANEPATVANSHPNGINPKPIHPQSLNPQAQVPKYSIPYPKNLKLSLL